MCICLKISTFVSNKKKIDFNIKYFETMKRISFKDSRGLNLTQAVLDGSKTMTRRAVPEHVERDAMVRSSLCGTFDLMRREKIAHILNHSPYKVGDVVAIQQAYKYLDEVVDLYKFLHMYNIHERFSEECKTHKGWTNKMFVKAELMHHHILITDVRVERLQDISDDDCMREGVLPIWDNETEPRKIYCYDFTGSEYVYKTARTAFSHLIDKVSRRGTWDSNPLVWVYSFELLD